MKWLYLECPRLYSIWIKMKFRCNNKNDPRYKNYWWRGISYNIDRERFENFYSDMYESYMIHLGLYWKKDTTIDRIDSNQHYCKENCRRSTQKAQQNNRTNNYIIEIDGVSKTQAQRAEVYGHARWLINCRIRRGRDPVTAVITPKK